MATVFTAQDEDQLEFVMNNFTLPTTFGIVAKGAKFTIAGFDGEVISPEAEAVLAQFPNALDPAEREAIIAFVDSEVLAGNWPLIDEFQCYALLDSLNAVQGWLGVGDSVPTNAPTHTPKVGFTFNGTTQYLDSGIDAGTLTNLSLDDGLAGCYINTVGAGNTATLFAVQDASSDKIQIENRSVNIVTRIGMNSTISPSPVGAVANNSNVIVQRIINTDQRLVTNGVVGAANGQASVAIPTGFNIYIGARNNAGLIDRFGPHIISSFVIGAAAGFDHTTFNTDLNNLLNSLAAIP